MLASGKDNNNNNSISGTRKGLFKDIWSTFAVMAVSLIIVAIFWAWFGHLGPSFSEDVLKDQQETLREKYGLPPDDKFVDANQSEIPPSLRNLNGTK